MRTIAAVVVAASVLGVSSAGGAPAGCNANRAWQDRYPVWSPKGDWIAFLRQGLGCDPAPQTLWIVHPNGTGARAVTNVRTYMPSWSPDGRRLVFGTQRGVEIASIDRTGRRLLAAHSVAPMWSPVGERIAYRGGFGDLVVVHADGTGRQTIVPMTVDFTQVAWSPDASRLAYSVDTSLTNASSHIELVNVDGSGRRRLTEPVPPSPDHQFTDRNPVWDSFGDTVAFESNREGNWEIYTVRAEGTDLRNVTRNPAEDIRPAWGPGKSQLAFISDRNQPRAPWGFRHSLLLVDLVTAGLSFLSNDVHPDSNVSWSPSGTTIAFAGGQECDRWGVYVFGALDVPRRTNRCVFEGTARGEKIVGSPFDDFLDGKGGNDHLFGGGGADTISGGQGADRIVGGAGADRIDGGRQRNVILAGPGDDVVAVANGWRDIVDCGTGRDTVIADSLDVLRHCEVRH